MNFKRLTSSLVTRLLAIGAIALAVGTVVTYTQLTRFLREDLIEVVSTQQTALASYVARDVDDELRGDLRFLERLAAAVPPGLLAQPERLGDWLGERHRLHPVFALGLVVIDLHGVQLAGVAPSGVGVGAGGPGLTDDPGFQRALGGQASIGRARIGSANTVAALPFAAPIRTGGKVVAVLVGNADLSTAGFLQHLLKGQVGRSGSILVISPVDKVFIASSTPGMLLQPTPAPGLNLLHDRAMVGFRGAGITVNAAGVEELSAIASIPSTDWFVVARLPTRDALATVARTQAFIVRQRMPAVLLVLLVLGLMFAYWLRPLFKAAAQAEKMTTGEAPLTPLAVTRDDEIGHLMTSFNRLLSKLAQSRTELAAMAHHDSLTGLPNRRMLHDRLQQALARTQRTGSQVALLFLDLDGFKRINDGHGHEAGDAVLKEVALRLRSVVRQTDTLARLGGDEFVLLATDLGLDEEGAARLLAQKCIEAVGPPLSLRGAEAAVGVSIGIVLSSGHDGADALLVAADKAMYEAKQKRPGGYVLTLARP